MELQKQFGFSVEKHKKFINDFQNAILNGEIDPVQAGVVLKRIEKVKEEIYKGDLGKKVKEKIYEKTEEAVAEGVTEIMGAKISIAPLYTSFDYSQCNHPGWDAWNEIEQIAKEKKKECEKELKLLYERSQKKMTDFTLGIQSTSEPMIYRGMPILELSDDEVEEEVNPPSKYQTKGPKYRMLS